MRPDTLTFFLPLLLLGAFPVRGDGRKLHGDTGRTILTQDEADSLHVVISQFITGGGLLSACFVVLMHTFKPFYTLFTEVPGPDAALQRREGGFGNVLSGTDLTDAAFNLMDVKDAECRKRAVCELQKAASGIPVLGRLLESASAFVSGLEKYRDAQQAGASFEACEVLFKFIYSSKDSSERRRRGTFRLWAKMS
ncbi:uncharacterized protein LOC122257244 [Penaeus japonicus]|uniref:uncharacterized protein LOC122257244 n=1 Tax=Penaeus japonicus TaxID=27405 RepID=UPI001C7144D4|nr:uncharacterized protein LOC122257244 [Penaeus japonicus]